MKTKNKLKSKPQNKKPVKKSKTKKVMIARTLRRFFMKIAKGKMPLKEDIIREPDNQEGFNRELLIAASRGKTKKVIKWLGEGADVNARCDGGWTALMYASANGHTKTAKSLIQKGADVNARDVSGRTALKHTSIWRHSQTAQLLKKYGAIK
jgi:ankyrin repeat protein